MNVLIDQLLRAARHDAFVRGELILVGKRAGVAASYLEENFSVSFAAVFDEIAFCAIDFDVTRFFWVVDSVNC